jgi:hypothetical protein
MGQRSEQLMLSIPKKFWIREEEVLVGFGE